MSSSNVVNFSERRRLAAQKKYEPGRGYVFPQPICARCTAEMGCCPWEERNFSKGYCIAYIDRGDCSFFFFVGTPLGEKEEYYFTIPAE
jgi:hypothetical protein